LNIICVDNSRLTLFSLRRMIGRIVPEACVFSSCSLKKAVETARKNYCDVLLTDIDIGGRENGGIDLARRIREMNPKVNIIFITNCPESDYAKDVLQIRFSGYLHKPCKQDELAGEFANLRYPVPARTRMNETHEI